MCLDVDVQEFPSAGPCKSRRRTGKLPEGGRATLQPACSPVSHRWACPLQEPVRRRPENDDHDPAAAAEQCAPTGSPEHHPGQHGGEALGHRQAAEGVGCLRPAADGTR